MFRRLVVPLDGSTTAERALSYAAAIARAYDASVLLLRAFPGDQQSARILASMQSVPSAMVDPSTVQMVGDSARTAEAEARAYLQAQTTALGAEGVQVTAAVIDADAGDAIVREAEREPDSLIVLSSHGHGGLEGLVIGSTAKHVLHKSHAPVMLIRVAEQAAQPEAKE